MKKAAVIVFLHLLWVNALHPQVLPEPSTYSKGDKELSDDYLRKNKHQRRTAIVLLVTGVGLASLGASASELNVQDVSPLFYLGSAGALCSVPLFLSAAKNRGRGELLLRMQSMPVADRKGRRIAGIGIGIHLNK